MHQMFYFWKLLIPWDMTDSEFISAAQMQQLERQTSK
jgi:hypothetical protein